MEGVGGCGGGGVLVAVVVVVVGWVGLGWGCVGGGGLPAKPAEDEEAHEVALPVVRLDAARLVEGTQRLFREGGRGPG